MALFDFLKKKVPAPAAYEVKEYSYTLAKHFKGFKKMPMEVHFYPECRENNELFIGVDVAGSSATFRDVDPDHIELWLQDKKIGVIEDKKSLAAIRDGLITDIYLKFEEDQMVTLDDAGNKKVTEVRHRFHLLVKYRD